MRVAGGEISLKAYSKGMSVIIAVENSYKNVEKEEISKFFDRFYRADKARTFTGGFGVGLSRAQGIAQKHKGSVSVYKKDSCHIGFKVILK